MGLREKFFFLLRGYSWADELKLEEKLKDIGEMGAVDATKSVRSKRYGMRRQWEVGTTSIMTGGKAGYLLNTCCWQTTRNMVPILKKPQSGWSDKTLQQKIKNNSVCEKPEDNECCCISEESKINSWWSRKFSLEVALDLELESRVGFY